MHKTPIYSCSISQKHYIYDVFSVKNMLRIPIFFRIQLDWGKKLSYN